MTEALIDAVGGDDADREVVEHERAGPREFITGLNSHDIKSGGWFTKLSAHAQSSHPDRNQHSAWVSESIHALRCNTLTRTGTSEIAEQIRLAFDAAFAGDQAAAAECVANAEALCAPILRSTTPDQAALPPSRSTRTIITHGISGRAISASTSGQLFVATDGSADPQGFTGWAYLATNGQWGCQAREYHASHLDRPGGVNGNSGPLITELRAVFLALTAIPVRFTLLADSTPALDLLLAWQKGDVEQMPTAYGLQPQTPDEWQKANAREPGQPRR
jgi:hypothetical protein